MSRPLQVGDHEAQEGRGGRQARQALRQADQEHRGGRAHRRRLPDGNPDAVRRDHAGRARTRSPTTTSTCGQARVGGEAGGADYQTIMYEGYGPAGVTFLVECLADNRNRAACLDVQVAMTRNGGGWRDRGRCRPCSPARGGDRPAHGVLSEDDVARRPSWTVAPRRSTTSARRSRSVVGEDTRLCAVRAGLQQAGIEYESAEASFVPKSVTVKLTPSRRRRSSALIERAGGQRRRAERLGQLSTFRRQRRTLCADGLARLAAGGKPGFSRPSAPNHF